MCVGGARCPTSEGHFMLGATDDGSQWGDHLEGVHLCKGRKRNLLDGVETQSNGKKQKRGE